MNFSETLKAVRGKYVELILFPLYCHFLSSMSHTECGIENDSITHLLAFTLFLKIVHSNTVANESLYIRL